MTSLLTLTAAQLLNKKPAQLFVSKDAAAHVHKELLKKWHPDRNKDPRAGEVVAHINSSYTLAKKAFENGGYPDTLTIKTSKGEQNYPYIAALKTELGELYICNRHIIYATERQYDDLVKQALDVSKAFKFPNDDIKAQLSHVVPRNIHTIANGDRAYTIMARDKDYVRVIDILAKGPIDPKHVAWIMSRAYNIAGWLKYSDLYHYDISPETMFVEPASHLGGLLGGWFYSGTGKTKPKAAPARSVHLTKYKRSKIHLSQIKTMGRRLLGCNSISELKKRADVPAPLKTWLSSAAGDNPVQEEKAWKETLIASFGPNRFTVMNLTTKDIYG